MIIMRLLTISALILAILFANTTFADDAENLWSCIKRNYLVSAYYSPLPNQRMYIRWSFAKDVILNWNWTNWADGTDVYMGLLAAPRGYSFWTKIILPWIWVGTVHDRGWAIVAKSNYDRIDVWMWRWEKWLSRALNWWMRFIEWEKCTKEVALKDTLDFTTISSKLPVNVERRLIANTVQDNTTYFAENNSNFVEEDNFEYVSIPINYSEWDSWDNVLKLQMILNNLWFYRDGVLTWIYDVHTMEAVYQFQRENGVIFWDQSLWAWNFGEKTKQALENYLAALHDRLDHIQSSMTWDILAGEIVTWKVENIITSQAVATKEPVLNIASLPLVKSELMDLDKEKTISNIQEMLKNKRLERIQDDTIIAWVKEEENKFMP